MQCLSGIGHMVFYGNDAGIGLYDVLQNPGPANDLFNPFPQQAAVAGNVGFAFGTIDQQQVDVVAGTRQFDRGRETCAAQADDAGLTDVRTKRVRVHCRVIKAGLAGFLPLVLAIGFNDDAHGLQA